MTPQKRPIKILKPFYGTPDGYNFNNAIVAFGKSDLVTNPNGKQGKRKRVKL